MLQINNLSKSFSGVKVLENIDFDVKAGEVHSVCGENGAGKSTLLKIISGIHPFGTYAGTVRMNGCPCRFQNTHQSMRNGIRMIFQELSLAPDLKVYENIFLNHEMRLGPFLMTGKMKQKSREMLKMVGGENIDISGLLSVGKQQLVEIARVLSQDCTLLILDEPTSALSHAEAKNLLKLLDSLRNQGMGIIYVSHKLDEVVEISNRITILRNGKNLGTYSGKALSTQKIISLMIGKPLDSVFPHKENPESKQPLLKVENLNVKHPLNPQRLQLKNISFHLLQGEILGLAGLMGSGRTELLETLFGIRSPEPNSQISLNHNVMKKLHPTLSVLAGILLAPEDRKRNGLWADASIKKNMTMGNLHRLTIFSGIVNNRMEKQTVSNLIDKIGIGTENMNYAIQTLSGGNQQKVIFSRFLMVKPKVLLLDDPTRGVDLGAKSEIYSLIKDLAAQGTGIIMCSSEQEELLGLCHRILVLKNGECINEVDGSISLEKLLQHAA